MEAIFSKENLFAHYVTDTKKGGVAYKYEEEGWNYKVEIMLKYDKDVQCHIPSKITLKTICKKEGEEHSIGPYTIKPNVGRNFGDFVSLLAAKIKYDCLIKDLSDDGAGFLHTKELIKLHKKGRTKIAKSTYDALNKVIAIANQRKEQKKFYFLNKVLIHPNQMRHLICFCGKMHNTFPELCQQIWWLNVSEGDIYFKDKNGKAILGKTLKKCLENIFAGNLLDKTELTEFKDEVIEKKVLEAMVESQQGNVDETEIHEFGTTAGLDKKITTRKDQQESADTTKTLDLPRIAEKIAEDVLRNYSKNLTSDISSKQVPEVITTDYFEDICITPLVRIIDDQNAFITPHEVLSLVDGSHSIIEGEPGSGKTHALRKLALDLLRQYPMRVIPVYISLASFNNFADKDEYDFVDHINNELCGLGCSSIDLLSQIPNTFILLLLDAWDEMRNEKARKKVKCFLSQPTSPRCIITSRREDLKGLPNYDRYEMEPLSIDRMREFLRLRIKDEIKVNGLIEWIGDTPSIYKFAKNPLNLSIISIISMEENDIFNLTENKLDLTKTKLYERAFEVILRQHYKANPYKGFVVDGRDQTLQMELLLQYLAYETMASRHGRSFLLRQLHLAAKKVFNYVPSDIDRILTGHLGIIRDRRSSGFEFYHPWYQEFLASQHIKKSDNIISELSNPNLDSCLFYVVGSMSSLTDVVKLMQEVKIHDPFSYCRAISEGNFSRDIIKALFLRILAWAENSPRRIYTRELARALSETGPVAVSTLCSIVCDNNISDYIRRSALEGVALVKVDNKKFDDLLLSLLCESSEGVLWHTIEHVGHRRLSKAREKLEGFTNSSNPITAGDAIWALSQIKNHNKPDISPDLIDALCETLAHCSGHIQGHALRTIGRLKIQEAIPKLRDHLESKTAEYRWLVLEAASRIGGCKAMEFLKIALFDEDIRVVASALKGIGTIQDLVPDDILKKVKGYVNSPKPVPFYDETIGSMAKSTLAKLKRKGMRGKFAQIFVARHCKTKWNMELKLQGTKDLPLCNVGIAEAHDNMLEIRNLGINRIYYSNTKRARETAEIYAESLQVPIHMSPQLREINHGVWEGHYIEELKANKSSKYSEWLKNPTSKGFPNSIESIISAQQRVLEEIQNIALSFRDETVLVISHKHLIAALMCALHDQPLEKFGSMIDESVEPRLLPTKSIAAICKSVIDISDDGSL